MKIISYYITDDIIARDDGKYCLQPPFIDFLLEGDGIKVFYHLDYNVACLLKMLGLSDDELDTLRQKQKLYRNKATSIVIDYIPHKWFSVKQNGQYAGFSDMSQYFDWKMERCEIIDCITKAKEAKDIGQTVFDALNDVGLHPRSLTSPVSVFEKEILTHIDIPVADDIPSEVVQYAYQCCHGSWLETFKKGHWDMVYDYDVTACFPYFTSILLDTRYGTWKYSDKYIPQARYGYCKGNLSIWETPSPFIYPGEYSYHCIGEWETYETKAKIDFLTEYGIGKFDIIDGWWWIPNKQIFPLYVVIRDLYLAREHFSGLSREVIKRVPNGIWGKFLEIWHDGSLGKYFNPVWAAEVENNSILKVARFIYDNKIKESLLSVAVDGVVSSSPVHSIKNNGMGHWRLSDQCPAFIISSGIVSLKNKVPTKDFGLRYDWLREKIAEDPLADTYSMKKLSPVTLRKSVTDCGTYDELGALKEITKTVDIRFENKRDYMVLPQNGKELLNNKYNSYAFDVSRLQIDDSDMPMD